IETLHVILAIFTIQQPVRVCHERWKLVLHTEELIDWIIVPLPLFAFDLHLQKPLEHMRGKLLGRRLAIERILAKLRQIALPPVKFLLLMRWRFVVELAVVAGDSALLDQAKRGEQP